MQRGQLVIRRLISTHTSLAGRDGFTGSFCVLVSISTHTSLAGRDCNRIPTAFEPVDFYSHVPRGT